MYLDYFTNKKKEKNVLMIDNSYRFWCNMLFEKCVRIFKWSGLPFKQKEIEMRLIMYGFCGFVNDATKGFMVANGGMSGVTQYFDEFTKFTYSAPTAKGGTADIDSECVIIDNTSLRNSLYPMIQRYASLLAHADISTKMALINLRDTNTYSAKDEGTADSIKKMQEQRYKGVDEDELEVSPAREIVSLKEDTSYKRVAAYCRVSTDDPNQTSSYELQKNHYEEYIKEHPGWELVGIYADEGISGTSLAHREEFHRMLDDCNAGKIDLIITNKEENDGISGSLGRQFWQADYKPRMCEYA